MAGTIVIFGAGASNALKCTPHTQCEPKFTPPLTNQLFDQRFVEVIQPFHLIKEKLGQISYQISEQGLESYLDFLANEGDVIAQRQLAEIQLYLRALFEEIQEKFLKPGFENVTPYYDFLRELAKKLQEATLITFNYDCYLDDAMKEVFTYRYETIGSYQGGKKYQLYKVHGSVDWEYNFTLNYTVPEIDSMGATAEWMVKIREEHVKRGIKTEPQKRIEGANYNVRVLNFPALAIPMKKEKGYVIERHKAELGEKLKQADKIIVIGWSAGDDFFVNEMMGNIDFNKAKLIVVSPNHPEKTIERLTPKKDSNLLAISGDRWLNEPKAIKMDFATLVWDVKVLKSLFVD